MIVFERLGKVRTPSCDDVVATPDPDMLLSNGVAMEDDSHCGGVELETEKGEIVLIRDTERVLSEDPKPSDR